VSGFVADEEVELLFVHFFAGEAEALKADGAVAEPFVLGEADDERDLGGRGGVVLGEVAVEKRRLLREEMALPASVTGPVESCAFCWFAMIWLVVDITYFLSVSGWQTRVYVFVVHSCKLLTCLSRFIFFGRDWRATN
jgi:hypothetical protein